MSLKGLKIDIYENFHMEISIMEMIRKFAKLSFFSHLEAYFSEHKDKGFEPPFNKEGFKKFQSIFFSSNGCFPDLFRNGTVFPDGNPSYLGFDYHVYRHRRL